MIILLGLTALAVSSASPSPAPVPVGASSSTSGASSPDAWVSYIVTFSGNICVNCNAGVTCQSVDDAAMPPPDSLYQCTARCGKCRSSTQSSSPPSDSDAVAPVPAAGGGATRQSKREVFVSVTCPDRECAGRIEFAVKQGTIEGVEQSALVSVSIDTASPKPPAINPEGEDEGSGFDYVSLAAAIVLGFTLCFVLCSSICITIAVLFVSLRAMSAAKGKRAPPGQPPVQFDGMTGAPINRLPADPRGSPPTTRGGTRAIVPGDRAPASPPRPPPPAAAPDGAIATPWKRKGPAPSTTAGSEWDSATAATSDPDGSVQMSAARAAARREAREDDLSLGDDESWA